MHSHAGPRSIRTPERSLVALLVLLGAACSVGVQRQTCQDPAVTRGRLEIPVGAELAVAQHLQDILLTREGRSMLEAAAESDDALETEQLATYLAESLIHGVEVDVHWPDEQRRR